MAPMAPPTPPAISGIFLLLEVTAAFVTGVALGERVLVFITRSVDVVSEGSG